MKRAAILLSLAFIFAHDSAQTSGVPPFTNFQGRLTDSLGSPVVGTYPMTFAVYGDSVGGSPLWTESHPAVGVSPDGLFNVTLGSVSPLPDSAFVDANRWLETRVDDTLVIPRTRLLTVPYAFKSGRADTAAYIESSRAYRRIATLSLGNATTSREYVKVGGVSIPAGEVSSFIVVVYRVGVNLALNDTNIRRVYIDLRIGPDGAEASTGEGVIAELSSTDLIASAGGWLEDFQTVQTYYEPTAAERQNGFDVELFMKVQYQAVSATGFFYRLEVYGR